MSLAPGRLDWRWAKASEVAEYTDSQAVYHLRDADPATIAAYRFRRAVDRGEPFPDTPIANAYELFVHRMEERLFIEGMLLAGAKNEDFAHEIPCSPEDVQAYHDTFFDVRERLNAPAWIIGRLFHGGLYGPTNLRDRSGIVHRIAWMAGPEIFRAFATGNNDVNLRAIMVDRVRDILAKQTYINSMCMSGRGELDVEVLRIFVDDTNKQAIKTVEAIGAKEGDGAAVAEFIRSFSLKVADPTDPRNLTLPAREPRAADYLVKPEVKDVIATDVR